MKKFIIAAFACLLLSAQPALAREPEPLTFGTLPVIQSLPVFVALEQGLFKAEGLEVELVPFRTAMDKDIAQTTGKVDGNFGDIFSTIFLRAGGTKVKVVALNHSSASGERMFGVLSGPDSGISKPADLAGVPVAVSSNTIIDFVTYNLLTKAGLAKDQVEFIEVKNIPIRFQMLLTGQVKAATLPEPLVTLAKSKGCQVVAQDSGTDLSITVLMFSEKFLKERPEDVEKFLTAINHAVDLINSGLDSVRPIMNQSCRIPKPLQATYPIPKFPKLALPSKTNVSATVNWLFERGAVKAKPGYSDLVDDGFIR